MRENKRILWEKTYLTSYVSVIKPAWKCDTNYYKFILTFDRKLTIYDWYDKNSFPSNC